MAGGLAMTVPAATEPTDTTVVVRAATAADVEALIALRTGMFQDADEESGPQGEGWQGACRQILLDGFAVGDLIGAVGETEDGTIVATGIATLRRWLPSPTNPSGLRGYIGSIATHEPWRRRGIGRRITEALVTALRERGAVDIELHATEAGEALYRSLGFVDHDAGTELTLNTYAS
jgi:ribosomal protein S18 acetylase RimI-like enzyme